MYAERNFEGKETFLLNLFTLLGKFHIHKSKWTGKKTRFQQFIMEVGHYIETLTGLKNQKAVKTMQICEAFGIGAV